MLGINKAIAEARYVCKRGQNADIITEDKCQKALKAAQDKVKGFRGLNPAMELFKDMLMKREFILGSDYDSFEIHVKKHGYQWDESLGTCLVGDITLYSHLTQRQEGEIAFSLFYETEEKGFVLEERKAVRDEKPIVNAISFKALGIKPKIVGFYEDYSPCLGMGQMYTVFKRIYDIGALLETQWHKDMAKKRKVAV